MSFLEFNLIVEGIDETVEGLDLYDHLAIDAANDGMVENAEALLGKSMRIVPLDKGNLEASGSARVNETEVAHGNDGGTISKVSNPPKVMPGTTITGEVAFNEPYAARQHEELSYEHKEGRQAKYLETPLKEFVRQFAQNIADKIKEVRR
jgi:hypothetical protein